MASDPEVEVFRIPKEWWGTFDRTANEVLLKLGFVAGPDGVWICGKDVAQRVVNTVCAYSFGWTNDEAGVAAGPQATPDQVLAECETEQIPTYDGCHHDNLSIVTLASPPGTRVRVVAVPTGDQEHRDGD